MKEGISKSAGKRIVLLRFIIKRLPNTTLPNPTQIHRVTKKPKPTDIQRPSNLSIRDILTAENKNLTKPSKTN